MRRASQAAVTVGLAFLASGCGLFSQPLLPARPVDRAPFERVIAAASLSVAKVGGTGCASGAPIGSAFVAGEDLVVTAAHVVAGARTVELRFPGREPMPAEVVVVDAADDTAILRVAGVLPPALDLAAAPSSAGEPVVVVGYPLGEPEVRTALARVTGVDETVVLGGRTLRDLVVIDAQVLTGSSGGPVVDAAGQVHAMASAQSSGRGGRDSSEVITLGIPASRLAGRLAASADLPTPVPCT